jgi:acylphosphatase
MVQEQMVRVRAVVHGRVQMVGFRAFVCDVAGGLHGTVRNLADGTVECVVEGASEVVDDVVARLHDGPVAARVTAVVVERLPATGSLPLMRIGS